MSSERTLLRVYADSKGAICYSKMISEATRQELAELIVMTRMLANHLEDEYEDIFLECRVMDDAEEAKIRNLIDRQDIPSPDANEDE